MNRGDRLNEGLSALADGECDELETARLLKCLRADAQMRRRWERIHLVRDLVRGTRASLLRRRFAERVARAIETEAHVLAPEREVVRPAPSRNWLRPLAGLAIAAGVAGVSVVGLRALQSPAATPPLAVTERAPAMPLASAVAGGTRWNLERVELEQRLNSYLLNHMEYATMGEMQGMLPYSRLAGYDMGESR